VIYKKKKREIEQTTWRRQQVQVKTDEKLMRNGEASRRKEKTQNNDLDMKSENSDDGVHCCVVPAHRAASCNEVAKKNGKS
jgi:hypothetical protein